MNLIISGTRKDFESIMNRLKDTYGKDAYLEFVIKSEINKYGLKECVILR
jgi:hypothetical protein